MDDKLREVALQGTFLHEEARQLIVTAIRLGGEPIGSIALKGPLLSDTALQALSNLVAIGLEKVRGQEAANRAEAARQSEELKSTLLDAIAHEFKTPLTSIKAATSSMLSAPGTMPPEQVELVTIVDEEADRLSRLVTEAIQMARFEGGKLQLNLELHSPGSLIDASLQQIEALSNGRQIQKQIDDALPYVDVDPELIQLTIRHLIDNAMKYSSPAAPIRISARLAGNNVVSIAVADQGPGISLSEQSQIFEKFYRSPRVRDQVTGTGMGLAIAREILHAHGGELRVISSPGKGSEFQALLPVAPAAKTM
jgi:two-component system sensor histidine kinase KdpD